MSPNKRSAKTAFRDAVYNDFLMQLGENGMPEYTDFGVGSDILAISQMVRGGDPTSLVDKILANKNDSSTTTTTQAVVDLIVLLFATRNTRGGKGEKDLSYKMFLRVWTKFPETGKKLLKLFAHYGYWKDYLRLMVLASEDPSVRMLDDAAMEIMGAQLRTDMASLTEYKLRLDKHNSDSTSGPTLSLLAKWLPREGTSFDRKISFVNRFTATLWPELSNAAASDEWKSAAKSKYRKIVAELTSHLELPEVLLSAHREDEINFQKVASKATLILTKTFLNENKDGNRRSNDPKRIRMEELFVEQMLDKGLKGGQVMPHEIVHRILGNNRISRSEELVLDAQWKDLWKTVVEQVRAKAEAEGLDFDPTRMVSLSDVSGSMWGVPMEVSIALGIGISEITHEAFRNMVMTFETVPRWHRLEASDSIVKKVQSLAFAPWGGSTNFLGAYELILDVARKNKLPREDLPSLIVFSDMQFNSAAGFASQSCDPSRSSVDLMTNIKCRVAKVAKELDWEDKEPTPIVFWNLRSTGGHPVDKATEGTVLLSGFSPSLLKLVMNGEALREEEIEIVQSDGTITKEKVRVTPEQVLRKMLDDSLYDPVREILLSSAEGALLEYGSVDKEPASLLARKEQEDEPDFELV